MFFTNHTNHNCWVIKQAGKLTVEEQGKGRRSEYDDEPCRPNNGGQKKLPPEVKTMNMIYVTHIPKKERNHAL